MNFYARLVFVQLCIQSIQSCTWSIKQCGCWWNDTGGKLSEKIVGGFESIPHSWPWIVSIRKRMKDKPLGLPICGGTLISDRHILTAAHCFYDSLVKAKESLALYLFVIGAHYSSSNEILADSIVRVQASSITIHEKYNARRQTDDVALIVLEEKINFENIYSGAICLPEQSETYPFDGTLTVAIGWGRLFETADSGSDTLQQVVLIITEGKQCDRIKSGNQMPSQLCAGSFDSQSIADTCQGDSGGPLMSRTDDGLWEIVGMTSYGKGCGRVNELGVYTRVSMYRNWIDLNMKQLDGYSVRTLNKPNNVFFNSAFQYSNGYWMIRLVCLLFIRRNQILFY